MNTTLRALVNQAERLVRAEAYEEAIALCHAILRRHPRYGRCYRILGEAHLGLGEHGAAADLFRRALGVDPEDPVGYAGLGIVFSERGLREEAIWQLERAFELAPGRDGLRRELARLYQERGSSGQVQLTRAALARLYARGGLWNKAICELHDLLAREPYRLDLRATLARTLWRAGQPEEAAKVAQTILDQAPNCLLARLILGAYWCGEGRADEGRSLLLGAEELDPEGREAARLLADQWPRLLEAVRGEGGPADEATLEVEVPEEAVEPEAPAPKASPLPVWLAAEQPASDDNEHIVTLPAGPLGALLGSRLEQDDDADGEDDLPGNLDGTEMDEAAAEAEGVPSPAIEPAKADDEDVTGDGEVAAVDLFGPDAPSTLLSPLALWQRRLDATPGDHEARLGLARALVGEGKLAEALPHYDALASLPSYLARVVGDLEAIAQVNVRDRALRELLGDAYARAGRFQDAMEMYRWLLEHTEPPNPATAG